MKPARSPTTLELAAALHAIALAAGWTEREVRAGPSGPIGAVQWREYEIYAAAALEAAEKVRGTGM